MAVLPGFPPINRIYYPQWGHSLVPSWASHCPFQQEMRSIRVNHGPSSVMAQLRHHPHRSLCAKPFWGCEPNLSSREIALPSAWATYGGPPMCCGRGNPFPPLPLARTWPISRSPQPDRFPRYILSVLAPSLGCRFVASLLPHVSRVPQPHFQPAREPRGRFIRQVDFYFISFPPVHRARRSPPPPLRPPPTGDGFPSPPVAVRRVPSPSTSALPATFPIGWVIAMLIPCPLPATAAHWMIQPLHAGVTGRISGWLAGCNTS